MHKNLYEYKLYKVNGKKILSMDNIKREVSFQCKNRQRDKQIGFFFAKEFCSNIAVLLEAGLANDQPMKTLLLKSKQHCPRIPSQT
jgi:hypothetical protein